MIRAIAIAALLWTLSVQGQAPCRYDKTLVLDWPVCGQKILNGTPLGTILGVPEGTVLSMDVGQKRTIRVHLYASTDSVNCPLRRWWIEGWKCNSGTPPSGPVYP